jgi:hypothetical protein
MQLAGAYCANREDSRLQRQGKLFLAAVFLAFCHVINLHTAFAVSGI